MSRAGKHRPDKCRFACYWTYETKAKFQTIVDVIGTNLSDLITQLLFREGKRLGVLVGERCGVEEWYKDIYNRRLSECRKQTDKYKIGG